MRKVIVVILSVCTLCIGYMCYQEFSNNENLKNMISDRNEYVSKKEEEKKLYETKQKKLDEIKENNKEKARKYDEVNSWNQEIIEYLD